MGDCRTRVDARWCPGPWPTSGRSARRSFSSRCRGSVPSPASVGGLACTRPTMPGARRAVAAHRTHSTGFDTAGAVRLWERPLAERPLAIYRDIHSTDPEDRNEYLCTRPLLHG